VRQSTNVTWSSHVSGFPETQQPTQGPGSEHVGAPGATPPAVVQSGSDKTWHDPLAKQHACVVGPPAQLARAAASIATTTATRMSVCMKAPPITASALEQVR